MVGGYRELRDDLTLLAASDAILALHGITEPTHHQRMGALLDAEFKMRVIRYLSGGK